MNVKPLENPVFQERFAVESAADNDRLLVRDGNKLYWAAYTADTRVLKMQKEEM